MKGGKGVKSQYEAIMETLFRIARKYQKAYCYPSQGRLLSLLRKYHHINISRRTLNRRLREMEDQGYFGRTRRHRRDDSGHMLFNSSLFRLMGRAFNWLYNLGAMAKGFFSFYRVPKLALYKSSTARDLSSGGKVADLAGQLFQKGGASRALSSPLKIST